VVQAYGSARAFAVPPDATAVGPALRTKRFHNFVACSYADAALHGKARAWARTYREKMTAGAADVNLYPNFALGHETMAELYGEGERVERLRGLKGKWDPENVFCHYLPLAEL
jgi:hypothetical protein